MPWNIYLNTNDFRKKLVWRKRSLAGRTVSAVWCSAPADVTSASDIWWTISGWAGSFISNLSVYSQLVNSLVANMTVQIHIQTLMPHTKTESKFDKNLTLPSINEIAEMKNCDKVIYFENRKHTVSLGILFDVFRCLYWVWVQIYNIAIVCAPVDLLCFFSRTTTCGCRTWPRVRQSSSTCTTYTRWGSWRYALKQLYLLSLCAAHESCTLTGKRFIPAIHLGTMY